MPIGHEKMSARRLETGKRCLHTAEEWVRGDFETWTPEQRCRYLLQASKAAGDAYAALYAAWRYAEQLKEASQ